MGERGAYYDGLETRDPEACEQAIFASLRETLTLAQKTSLA